MQTFLPYPDFARSAAVLDYRRLGKQRVEALQILRTLLGVNDGWRHHPAVKMWKGYEVALADYAIVMCDEWKRRGYKDTCAEKITDLMKNSGYIAYVVPFWLGDAKFHESHRSNLLRKQPEHYRQYWPSLTTTLPYIWPVKL